MSRSKVKAKRVTIDGTTYVEMNREFAQDALEHRVPNRNISQRSVNTYALQMLKGEWLPVPQPIMFDKQNRMIDGQQRTTAYLKASDRDPDVKVLLAIAENCDHAVMDCVDQGRSRSLDDNLRIRYGTSNARKRLSWLRRAAQILAGSEVPIKTPDQYNAWSSVMGPELEWAIANIPFKGKLSTAPVAAALMIAYRSSPETVEMAVGVVKGEVPSSAKSKNAACYMLREYLTAYMNRPRNDLHWSDYDSLEKTTFYCLGQQSKGRTVAHTHIFPRTREAKMRHRAKMVEAMKLFCDHVRASSSVMRRMIKEWDDIKSSKRRTKKSS